MSLENTSDFRLRPVRTGPLSWQEMDNMFRKLLKDGVLSFYLSGKLIHVDGKLESVHIKKLTPYIDQTVYGKKFNTAKKKIEKIGNVSDISLKNEIFKNDELDVNKLKKSWDTHVTGSVKITSNNIVKSNSQRDKDIEWKESLKKRWKLV